MLTKIDIISMVERGVMNKEEGDKLMEKLNKITIKLVEVPKEKEEDDITLDAREAAKYLTENGRITSFWGIHSLVKRKVLVPIRGGYRLAFPKKLLDKFLGRTKS